MSWLLIVGLKNAILVAPLAVLAWGIARWAQRPALSHLLWSLVLVKLLTPPLVDVPIGWRIDVESWLGYGAPAAVATSTTLETATTEHLIVPSASGRSHAKASDSRIDFSPARHPRQVARLGRAAAKTHNATPIGERTPATAEPPLLVTFWNWLRSSATWLRLASAIWLGGSFVMLGTMALRALRFQRYVSSAACRHEYLAPRVGELAATVGLTVAPRVLVVDGVVSPMLWGLGRQACLVFPAKLSDRLRPSDLDALLLHELAHFARGDHWVRALELVASILFWWHPIVWWARRELETSEEQCCDAWVVEHQSGTRHAYAEALLTTIDFLSESPSVLPPAACGLGEVSELRVRLAQIMRGDVASRLSNTIKVLVLTVGIALSPLEPTLWATSSPSQPRPVATAKIAEPPIRNDQAKSTWSNGQVVELVAPAQQRIPTDATASVSLTAVSPGNRLVPRPLPIPKPAVTWWASAASPNGKYRIEARTGRRITLVNVDTGFRLDLTSHQITCVSFASNSQTFATGHEDSVVRLWDSETGGLLQSFKGCRSQVTSVAISRDGRRLAAGSQGGDVQVWDLATGDEIAGRTAPESAIGCVRWSHRGDRLAITLGDWSQREPAIFVWSPDENVILAEQLLREPAGAIQWLAQDDALVIADWNGLAQVWRHASREFVSQMQLEKDQISASAWSPDCPLVNQWVADQFLVWTE